MSYLTVLTSYAITALNLQEVRIIILLYSLESGKCKECRKGVQTELLMEPVISGSK
jgi:hypothetical protein